MDTCTVAPAGTAERRMIMADFLRCKDCKHDKGKCVGVSRRASHKNCFEPKAMTNADRIRAMTDEELAAVIMCPKENGTQVGSCIGKTCVECCLMWLRQPVEEDTP